MANVLDTLGYLASQNHFLAYFIVYLSTIFLGNISAFIAFWVMLHGAFGTWGLPLLLLTIILSDFTGDMLWYSLGYALRDTKFGNFLRAKMPRREKIEAALEKNGVRLVFISKFLYASAFPVIFSVGWTKMEFKKFLKVSALSILIWVPILFALAYGLISGLTPLRAIAIFKKFEVVFIIGLAAFIAIDYLLAKLFKYIFKNKDW